jgi:hypothetical protein
VPNIWRKLSEQYFVQFLFCICSLSVMRITAAGRHLGPMNWNPGPGEIPLLHVQWNLSIKDTFGPDMLSLIERCSDYRGQNE